MAFLIPFVTVIYFCVLRDKMLFNWFKFGERFREKEVFKPLWGCEVCNVGQLTLISYPFIGGWVNGSEIPFFLTHIGLMYLIGLISNRGFYFGMITLPIMGLLIFGESLPLSIGRVIEILIVISVNIFSTLFLAESFKALRLYLKALNHSFLLKYDNKFFVVKSNGGSNKSGIELINEAETLEELNKIEGEVEPSSINKMKIKLKRNKLNGIS